MKIYRLEYFFNAIHYCIYKEEVWSNYKIEKQVYKTLRVLSTIFCLKKKYEKRVEELRKNKEVQEFFYGKESGQAIGIAHHLFGYFYSGYPGYISLVLLGVYFRVCDELNQLIFWLLIILPIVLFYIPVYKTVFYHNNYLNYFKQFEKEDEHWHRKWKRITIAFVIGSIIAILLGILSAWGIMLMQ